jgi:cycloeucalenol cycloisomerase
VLLTFFFFFFFFSFQSAPALIGPALLRGGNDWSRAYWLKANVWIAIFGFIGNYFWTHYFYTVLGASYSFPVTWHLNGVPVLCYLITHAYFIAYHTFAAVLLRRVRTGGL